MANKTEEQAAPVEAVKQPSAKAYVIKDKGTTLSIFGITEEQGKRFAQNLEGQVDASTDHQLKSAVRNLAMRLGVTVRDVTVSRTI